MKAPVTTLTRLASAAVAALLSLALQACGSADTGTAAGQGAVGEPCFPNATCNAGLSCNAGQCETVSQAEGEAGGPCYPNATCNAGLDCSAGLCVDPTIPRGELGGPCYPNATCNAGYDCVGGLCAEPSTTDTGGDGSGADTGTAADADAGDAAGDTIDDTSTDTGPPPLCGNEVVESGEECDEVAPASFDCPYGETSCSFCDVDCRLVPGAIHLCGDAVLDAEEVCDPGLSGASAECGDDCNCAPGYHLESGSCVTDIRPCELPNASAAEQVWDPSLRAFGRCEAIRCNSGYSRLNGDCVAVGCGNGVLEPGEACDDGNLIREDGCTSYCEVAACGDGIVWAGVEACDDGNRETEVCGYGLIACSVCNGSCARQPGATSFCGDGIIDAGEVCDDANASDTDGCNRGCLCGSGFHPEAGDCALDIRPCTIENAEAAEETWSGGGYGVCLLVACDADFHATLNACEPDEIACEAPNAASAVQRWDGLAYGDCTILSCVAEHHLEAGACLPDIRDCSLANATVATQPWLPATSSYGACEASTCAAGYRLQFGTCVAGYVQVDAGEQHACAVTAEGNVHCWGRNVEGQLGDGTTTSRTRPVRVLGLPAVREVSAGLRTCALTQTGLVYCWGAGISGSPALVSLPRAAVEISGGGETHCATLTDGTMRCWQAFSSGISSLIAPGPLTGVIQTTVATQHYCATRADATAWCSGNNNLGQIGLGFITGTVPATASGSVTGLITAVELAAGRNHTCARLAEGTVKCWGQGFAVGDGYTTNRAVPTATAGIENAVSIAAGEGFSCAVVEEPSTGAKRAKCWGANYYGALGNGTIGALAATPVDVVGLTNPESVAAGQYFACALEEDATVACWGPNEYGQLGDGTTTQRLSPVPLREPVTCGDGIVGPTEFCDGDLLSGRTCESFGFGGGAVACRADCSGFDTANCTSVPRCGDFAMNGAEACDGTDLGGLSCVDFGFVDGALTCRADCTTFDTTSCSDTLCGDGIRNGTEQCDSADFGTSSCYTEGFEEGVLACGTDCRRVNENCSLPIGWCSATPRALAVGSSVVSTLDAGDPTDGPFRGSFFEVYEVELMFGQTVYVSGSGDIGLHVRLYRACNAGAFAEATAGPRGVASFTALVPYSMRPYGIDKYYIMVAAASPGAAGTVSLFARYVTP